MRAEPRHLFAATIAAVVLAGAGCTVESTGAVVTLVLPSGVTLSHFEASVITTDGKHSDIYSPPAENATVFSGASFAVALPESLDGTSATIDVHGYTATGDWCGSQSFIVQRRRIVRTSIDLVSCPCSNQCQGGVLTSCGGDLVCEAGCAADGVSCSAPSCDAPAEISIPQAYHGNNLGVAAHFSGSCGGAGGGESVYKIHLSQYANVYLSLTQSTFLPVLYTSLGCGGAEVPAGGLCTGGSALQVSACQQGAGTQVLCGMPPGEYYTFVDSSGSGGAFTLTPRYETADLNDCAGAGAILQLPATIKGTTAGNENRRQAPSGTPTCGDLGSGPEAVYYVPLPNGLQGQRLTARVTAPSAGYKPLLYVQQQCQETSTVCSDGSGLQNGVFEVTITEGSISAGPGPYFIFVDGSEGTSGSFTLDVSVN